MSALSQTVRGIRNLWGHADDDDYGQDEMDAADTQNNQQPQRSTNSYSGNGYGNYNAQSQSSAPTPTYGGGSGASGARRLRAVPSALRSSREKNIYTLKPKSQDDAAIAADYLKTGTAVILNLEDVDRANAIRIIDFMSGVCYGLEGQGHAMKLRDTIFLYTPPDFDISSDEVDYGENPDFFFKDVEPVAAQNGATPHGASPAAQVATSTHAPTSAGSPIPSSSVPLGGYTNPAVTPNTPTTSYQTNERRSWER